MAVSGPSGQVQYPGAYSNAGHHDSKTALYLTLGIGGAALLAAGVIAYAVHSNSTKKKDAAKSTSSTTGMGGDTATLSRPPRIESGGELPTQTYQAAGLSSVQSTPLAAGVHSGRPAVPSGIVRSSLRRHPSGVPKGAPRGGGGGSVESENLKRIKRATAFKDEYRLFQGLTPEEKEAHIKSLFNKKEYSGKSGFLTAYQHAYVLMNGRFSDRLNGYFREIEKEHKNVCFPHYGRDDVEEFKKYTAAEMEDELREHIRFALEDKVDGEIMKEKYKRLFRNHVINTHLKLDEEMMALFAKHHVSLEPPKLPDEIPVKQVKGTLESSGRVDGSLDGETEKPVLADISKEERDRRYNQRYNQANSKLPMAEIRIKNIKSTNVNDREKRNMYKTYLQEYLSPDFDDVIPMFLDKHFPIVAGKEVQKDPAAKETPEPPLSDTEREANHLYNTSARIIEKP